MNWLFIPIFWLLPCAAGFGQSFDTCDIWFEREIFNSGDSISGLGLYISKCSVRSSPSFEINRSKGQYKWLDTCRIFEWHEYVGIASIMKLDSTTKKIDCWGALPTRAGPDSIKMEYFLFATVFLNTKTCAVQRHLKTHLLPSKPPKRLIRDYPKYRDFILNKRQIDPQLNNSDFIFIYLFDLMVAALNGDAECEKLFYGFSKDFDEYQWNMGWESFYGCKMVISSLIPNGYRLYKSEFPRE